MAALETIRTTEANTFLRANNPTTTAMAMVMNAFDLNYATKAVIDILPTNQPNFEKVAVLLVDLPTSFDTSLILLL